MRQEEHMSEPTKRSVWVSVLVTVVAMLIAKACVAGMTEKPRARSAYSGGR